MKKTVLIMTLAFWMIACGNKSSSNTGVEKAKKEISGAKIFQKSCVLCHGEDGKLGLNGSKDLTKSKMSMKERISIITNGKGTMVGFKGILSDKRIKAVAEFTAKLVTE